MKRVSLENLLENDKDTPYIQQYERILHLMEAGRIKPLKASGTNGKTPALYREYWLAEEKKDYSSLIEELTYSLVPEISVDYYLAHPDAYEQDREWVVMLSEYLRSCKEKLRYPESVNERSFEIWGREKFLTKEQGKRILKRCGMGIEHLNIYGTAEPLAYYSHTRCVPQNILILENKDTFYSMRRHLMDGNTKILGLGAGTLIYGAGKGILRSFQDFDLCAEPYMKDKRNCIYYFGDLDYEGVGIYERLAESVPDREITPFVYAYEAMLEKAKGRQALPDTKEQQNQNIRDWFFSYFQEECINEMKQILENGKYIPQEILNITDF